MECNVTVSCVRGMFDNAGFIAACNGVAVINSTFDAAVDKATADSDEEEVVINVQFITKAFRA